MAANSLTPEQCTPESAHSFSMDKVESLLNESMLLRTPYPVMAILACYLLIVLKVGPTYMVARQPYNLSTVMRLYNVCQVAINGFIAVRLFTAPKGVECYVKNECTMADLEHCEENVYLYFSYFWVILFLKTLDLADTVFMVLRKKNVTFLHLYHHVTMVVTVWFAGKYTRTFFALFPGVLNVVVHTVMYSYYFLASFPQLKKYLWWKSHLTKLQLIQFFLILMYFGYLYANNCHVPRLLPYVAFNMAVFCLMFIKFYVKEYLVETKVAEEISSHEDVKKPQ